MIIIRGQYSKWFAVCWDLCQGQNINMQNLKYNNIKKRIRTKTIQEGTIPSSETFIAKEDKDIRLVQQQIKQLCKCKYVNNDYASCGPQA